MGKVWVIFRREYLTRLRSHYFIVMTLLMPLFYGVFEVGRAQLKANYAERVVVKQRLAIVGYDGDRRLYQRLNELLGGVADGPFMHFALGAGWRGGKYAFEFQPENWARGESWSACQQRLEREVAAGHLAGYIVAGPEVLAGGGREVQIHTQAARDLYQTERLRRVLRLALTELRLAQAGLAHEPAGRLARSLQLVTVTDGARQTNEDDGDALDKTAAQAEAAAAADFRRTLTPEAKQMLNKVGWWIALTIMIVLLQFYAGQIWRGVVEEKSSRIVEVLLSSVTPAQLMSGKLLGIGAVGLTQLVCWAGLLGTLHRAFGWTPFESVATDYSFHLTWQLGVWFAVFFLLAYFLCSTFSLIVGALVSPETNAAPALGMLMLVFSPALQMPLLIYVLSKPASLPAALLSLIPVFSPSLMFARIAVQQPPWWQVALALALLLGSIWVAVALAAKIYRLSILAQGTPPSLRQLRLWLRTESV